METKTYIWKYLRSRQVTRMRCWNQFSVDPHGMMSNGQGLKRCQPCANSTLGNILFGCRVLLHNSTNVTTVKLFQETFFICSSFSTIERFIFIQKWFILQWEHSSHPMHCNKVSASQILNSVPLIIFIYNSPFRVLKFLMSLAICKLRYRSCCSFLDSYRRVMRISTSCGITQDLLSLALIIKRMS